MTEDHYTAMRHRMVETQIAARRVSDPRVLSAMRQVPRHRFIPSHLWDQAYSDYPLPIGEDQTISQPYIVALMTELLELKETDRVLEIGTGSGYQAAILAHMGARVVTIERDAGLAAEARERLVELRIADIEVELGDGSAGWPAGAPYDGILVAAACPEAPEPLLAELADGGRLVAPVGNRELQELTVIRRVGRRLETEVLEPCVFVPLIGRFGFPG
jgi:protein-L-isoaspartate(D-aspartate) O-methyltransferase